MLTKRLESKPDCTVRRRFLLQSRVNSFTCRVFGQSLTVRHECCHSSVLQAHKAHQLGLWGSPAFIFYARLGVAWNTSFEPFWSLLGFFYRGCQLTIQRPETDDATKPAAYRWQKHQRLWVLRHAGCLGPKDKNNIYYTVYNDNDNVYIYIYLFV